jgi:hypothetical protein
MLIVGAKTAVAQDTTDALLRSFRAPPDAAKPWITQNLYDIKTKEEIRFPLDWMKRVGVGGVMLGETVFNAAIREGSSGYLSTERKQAFTDTVELAAGLGLRVSLNSSPGWTLTGGPWVKPQQAMKKLVWSTQIVNGGRHLTVALEPPPKISGPFQDVSNPPSPDVDLLHVDNGKELPEYYAEVAVIAYRISAGLPATSPPRVTITTSNGPLDAKLFSGGRLRQGVSLPAKEGAAWVHFAYDRPYTIRSAVLATPMSAPSWAQPAPLTGRLEAQDESGNYRLVGDLTVTTCPQVTISFKPVTARDFRILLAQPADQKTDTPMVISELSLRSSESVHEFERKAGFAVANDYYALATTDDSTTGAVALNDVIDLSDQMSPDGSLHWSAPPGRWGIIRLGYSLTGEINRPAPPDATGLEVDKLSSRYLKEYMDYYLGSYTALLPPSLKGTAGFTSVFEDSTEVEPQNWTDDMLEQFERHRGYDPRPWLPTLTGVIVQSARASDKFLWDFRRTIAQLTAENHYAAMAANAHAYGLTYANEAMEYMRPVLGDDMEMRRYSDAPTGAMWAIRPDQEIQPSYLADIRGAASVAHLYGQNVAFAESFTNADEPGGDGPRDLKPIADLELALGTNRLFMSGDLVNVTASWSEMAGPWMAYLSRSSYLLQQGRFAADVAYFYGEEAPLTVLQEEGRLNDTSQTHGFDFVGADAVLHLLEAKDGYLTTPSGMRYRALQLGGSSRFMSLPVLRKLRDFAREGVIVVGAPPIDTPSLSDDKSEFQTIKAELWKNADDRDAPGSGHVYETSSIDDALASEHIPPDVVFRSPRSDTKLIFNHRSLANAEIYFVNNRMNRREEVEVSFRVSGKSPERWHAETGQVNPLTYRIDNGRTILPLEFKPQEGMFIVFRKDTRATRETVPDPQIKILREIQGPWTVKFLKADFAPSEIETPRLDSWSDNPNPKIRFFSGAAIYSKAIDAPRGWFRRGRSLLLDLGNVRDLAEVSVNKQNLGIVWESPYIVDVTGALHSGRNVIEVKVANLEANHLLAGLQPGAAKPAPSESGANMPWSTYTSKTPLFPSGLLGPVRIEGGERAPRHGSPSLRAMEFK